MKRALLLAAALLVLGISLLFASPVTSSHSWKYDSGSSTATVDQEANSNIWQDAKVFSDGWNAFADADQEANSNIGQDAKVFSSSSSYASVDQEANSNIGQKAKVKATKNGKATVDQAANSNIQQNAKVKADASFSGDKTKKYKYDRGYDRGSDDEPRYGICVIGVDSPCNAEQWE